MGIFSRFFAKKSPPKRAAAVAVQSKTSPRPRIAPPPTPVAAPVAPARRPAATAMPPNALPPKAAPVSGSRAMPPSAAKAPAPQPPAPTSAPKAAQATQAAQAAQAPQPSAAKALVPGAQPQNGEKPALRRILANESVVQEILAYTGMVFTASGGGIEVNDRQKAVAAYLENGSLLVHKDNPISPESMEVRDTIRRMKREISVEYLVELEVIRKVHEAAERRTGHDRARNRGGESLQKMQHEVLNLIHAAANNNCSDIHVMVGRHEAVIKMRKDGVMMNIRQTRSDWASDLCSAAFNMADASDSSYRIHEYQGARISEVRTPLPEGVQAVRLQFNPLPNGGRYMVARLLYANSVSEYEGDVDTLGYAATHVEQLQRMRRKPFGINIISGPTGSGKSTTLQRALVALMREKRNQVNVITIEDPPEYVISGASQLPVLNAATEEERDEKFRAAISASLRSDPDIIMIGEIRDRSSASLAFTAAMTGHQVWASLHTNDAISILDRLRDQGVEIYKLSDNTLITGLIGQRLIRKLCPHCRLPLREAIKKEMVSPSLMRGLERLFATGVGDDGIFFAGDGKSGKCRCRDGYIGREVVAETICPDANFMRFVSREAKMDAVEYWLAELGGITMLEHAIQKTLSGMCDPRDVEDRAGEILTFNPARAEKVLAEYMGGRRGALAVEAPGGLTSHPVVDRPDAIYAKPGGPPPIDSYTIEPEQQSGTLGQQASAVVGGT